MPACDIHCIVARAKRERRQGQQPQQRPHSAKLAKEMLASTPSVKLGIELLHVEASRQDRAWALRQLRGERAFRPTAPASAKQTMAQDGQSDATKPPNGAGALQGSPSTKTTLWEANELAVMGHFDRLAAARARLATAERTLVARPRPRTAPAALTRSRSLAHDLCRRSPRRGRLDRLTADETSRPPFAFLLRTRLTMVGETLPSLPSDDGEDDDDIYARACAHARAAAAAHLQRTPSSSFGKCPPYRPR